MRLDAVELEPSQEVEAEALGLEIEAAGLADLVERQLSEPGGVELDEQDGDDRQDQQAGNPQNQKLDRWQPDSDTSTANTKGRNKTNSVGTSTANTKGSKKNNSRQPSNRYTSASLESLILNCPH